LRAAVAQALEVGAITRDAVAQFLYPREDWGATLFSLAGHPHHDHHRLGDAVARTTRNPDPAAAAQTTGATGRPPIGRARLCPVPAIGFEGFVGSAIEFLIANLFQAPAQHKSSAQVLLNIGLTLGQQSLFLVVQTCLLLNLDACSFGSIALRRLAHGIQSFRLFTYFVHRCPYDYLHGFITGQLVKARHN